MVDESVVEKSVVDESMVDETVVDDSMFDDSTVDVSFEGEIVEEYLISYIKENKITKTNINLFFCLVIVLVGFYQ